MDAHNAAESDQTKPAGASPLHQQKPSSGSNSTKNAPSVNVASPTKKNTSAATSADGPEDRDSDAETIVLPGKDGHSPSKARKVRQEDKSDGDADASKGPKDGVKTATGLSSNNNDNKADGDNKRLDEGENVKKKHKMTSSSARDDRQKVPRSKDGSSGLSSAPTSPPQRRRRSVNSCSSPSDGEHSQKKLSTSRSLLGEKLKAGERSVSHKRKAPRTDSDDEDEDDHETRKARRQRTTSAGFDGGRHPKDHRSSTSRAHDTHNRSTSPPRLHRRSASSQLPYQSSNGSALKKKRLPPPLQPTEYHSDESSASNSPHPRNAKLKSVATPAHSESNMSPAKVPSHKKHLDAHGQTLLARACARGEFEGAKQRLRERPEDLNVADYAGNTPLQIAAINGCEDIVALLIDAGCNLDCVNYDKDTPLLDAVDNGHLGVVKLLLDAGVNPRKANVNGEEPFDRVFDDTDNADEIRAALTEAKKRYGGRTKTSEERQSHLDSHDARDSHAPDSPRQSPAAALPSGRRSGTVRSTKTRNDLLYMPLDDKTLRQAAGRGDEETVARILQVKSSCNDAEPMVAAARGGHDLVIQLLLGLGGADPDPAPVSSQPDEFATPILAAIGQENIKVLELLLQQGLDPTRRFRGETYYEIARRRQGTNWKEEEQMLKDAYDAYKSSTKPKAKSPGRRERERDREEKRARREERGEGRLHKPQTSSPTRETESRRKLSSSKLSSPKEKRKPDVGDEGLQKRGKLRQKKDDRLSSMNASDREVSPSMSHKHARAKRHDSEVALSSDGEAQKPARRKKLVSKGELSKEREKQRRSSVTSNASSLKEPSSPHDSRHEDSSDRTKLSERYHDRAKALKREESKDHGSGPGDSSAKRHRVSLTPDRPGHGEKDDGEIPSKRRRLEGEAAEKRQKRPSSSADAAPRKQASSQHSSHKSTTESGDKKSIEHRKSSPARNEHPRKENVPPFNSEPSVHIKSEDVDVEMPDAEHPKESQEVTNTIERDHDEEQERKQHKKALLAEEKSRKEAERKRAEAEEEERKKRLKQEEEERARKLKEEEEAAERKRKEEEDREAERKRQELARRKREEEEEKARQEAEKARREQEERRRIEEEKKRQAEEERKRREREEEEERLRKEREAAEEARRKREEEERKERERRERLHREEMERKRAAREAEQRRIREEQEKARLDKLPPLLRWLDTCPNPKNPVYAEKFKTLQGVRYDTIRPEANRTPEGREQWVLNTHAALLLGEKDLDLSRYTAWERVPASHLAKVTLWRVEGRLYTLLEEKTWDLGRELPDYYGVESPLSMSLPARERLKQAAWERFRDMELFFVKVSDLLYTVPNTPHLRNIKLAVTYRELIENDAQMLVWRAPQKWKQDPDANRFGGFFGPRSKYYLNGVVVGEDAPTQSQTSTTPFVEKRVPRRGLLQVFPDDPDYARICVEQGLEHLVNGHKGLPLPNGVHSPPASQAADTPAPVNDDQEHEVSKETHLDSHAGTNGSLLNGVNGN